MSTTSDKQIKASFLRALRQGQTVANAAKQAGVNVNKLYYQWRSADPAFDAAWRSIMQAKPSGSPGRPWPGSNGTGVRKPRVAGVAFLKALSKGASVTDAAEAAGVSRARVYQWAQADKAFAQAWDEVVQNRQSIR